MEPLTIGATLSHYRILERLGAGGMGVVYRAHDQRLERDVAIKVLPEGSLADPETRQRFRREALALSRLNHPHIAVIHDFDHQDGTDFLVMELVEGRTLAELLAEGPLPEPEIARLGGQIAEALEAAHQRGVVHRDLKPGNLVVTPQGRVKVLDFGIASLYEGESTVSTLKARTGTELGAGTLLYMSPERLLGASGDARSDLYSLGVVLYEMATARPPFSAPLATALVYEITNRTPVLPSTLRPGLTARLEETILRCMDKNPAERYESARTLAEDLGRLGTLEAGLDRGGDARAIRSLAVLPFENLSGDPEQEYFTDGMTDALIADLAQIAELRVISRTSVMRLKGTRKPLPEIARELKVEAIVAGTVLRAGERVRISAQLIEGATDRHLWAKTYQREVCDILELQGEVAAAIVAEIRATLTPSQQARMRAGRTLDPRAFEAYLRGRQHWNRRTETEVRKGVEFFQRAIEIEPGYALAYAGLADSYNILGDQDAMTPQLASSSAKAAATRALELDDRLAEAHTSLGFAAFFYDWDWAAAEQAFRRAIASKPSYATAHQWFAEFLISQGRFDEAIAEARTGVDLDPLSFVIRTSLADVYYFSRRYDEAIQTLRETIQLEPSFVPAHTDLGRVYAQVGRHDESIAEFLEGARLKGANPDESAGLGHSYAAAGRRDDALRVARRLEALRGSRVVSGHAIAVIYLALGERDTAIEWLRRALADSDRALVWIKVHPRLDPLRDDPRFQEIERALGRSA